MASVLTEATAGSSPPRPPIGDIYKGEKLSASFFGSFLALSMAEGLGNVKKNKYLEG